LAVPLPREGGLWRGEIFAFALLQPARSVCISLSAFFIIIIIIIIIIIPNSAGDKFNDYMVTNAIVSNDGEVLLMYPALIKTYCTLNVKYFPFDSQHCDIQFISWTHNGQQLDIFYNESNPTAVYYASANQVGQPLRHPRVGLLSTVFCRAVLKSRFLRLKTSEVRILVFLNVFPPIA